MENIPDHLKYTRSHEWVRVEANVATVGITDHAQRELTDVVYFEPPQVGGEFETGHECAAVASVFTPVPGGIGPIAVAMLFKNLSVLAGRA